MGALHSTPVAVWYGTILTIVAAGTSAQPAQGQTPVETGNSIRAVHRPTGLQVAGRVVSMSTDSLWLEETPSRRRLGWFWRDLDRLQVRAGERSNALLGLAIGAGTGAALGAGFALAGWGRGTELPIGDRLVAGSLTFAAAGAGLGAFIGMFSTRDVWKSATIQFGLSDLGIVARGVRITLSVRF